MGISGSAKTGSSNRCPYRRFGVDTEIPYRTFVLILCSAPSHLRLTPPTRWILEAIEAVDTPAPTYPGFLSVEQKKKFAISETVCRPRKGPILRQKGGFGGCSPGTKTRTRIHSDVPPERNTGTRVLSHVPPGRQPEQGYVRQNHPFMKPPFCLPLKNGVSDVEEFHALFL